jgi:DNA ligase (NAD+)
MNIDHVGVALVEALTSAGKLKSPADLYDLTETDLLELERMAEKSAARVLQSIRESKDRGLEKLLFGLGLRHVGKTVAQILARHFQTIDVLAKASAEELAAVHEVGPRIAASVASYFSSENNRTHLERLKAAGLSITAAVAAESQPLVGQTWVVTGTLPNWSRDEARDALEKAGARVSDSVSKKTSAVLVGENAGSKLAKAEKLGVKIMNESEVRALLK